MRIPFVILFLISTTLTGLAQSTVTGNAPVTLVEGPTDCNGSCKTVEVYVDVRGLQGASGAVGLNAFVLAFNLSRGTTFASVRRGTSPNLNWSLFASERTMVMATNRLVIVGAVADGNAPTERYHVATIVLCGAVGGVTLSLIQSESSLGSRWIPGDVPGLINIQPPAVFPVAIQSGFSLAWGTGIGAWLTTDPAYDLAAPGGAIDVADLVKLVNCGLP